MARSSLLTVADILNSLREDELCDAVNESSSDESDQSFVEQEDDEDDVIDDENESAFLLEQPIMDSSSVPRSATTTFTETSYPACNEKPEIFHLYFNSKKDFFWNSTPRISEDY